MVTLKRSPYTNILRGLSPPEEINLLLSMVLLKKLLLPRFHFLLLLHLLSEAHLHLVCEFTYRSKRSKPLSPARSQQRDGTCSGGSELVLGWWGSVPSASLSFQLWEAWVKNSLLRAELLSLAIPSGPICDDRVTEGQTVL